MFDRLKGWWAGQFRPTPLDNILSDAPYENIVRPWPARWLNAARVFWLKEWKWILGFVVAAIGAFGLFR